MTQQNNNSTIVGSNLNLKPPTPLSFEGNVAENWVRWLKKFKIYMLATESINKPDNTKVAILLHAIGEEALEKFETFELTEEQQQNYNNVVKAFEDYCVPRKNESVCRHLFFLRSQKSEENFDDFLTDLKRLSIDCAFGELKDSLIKDRIVSGIQSKQLKDRLLREENLTLDKAVRLCKAAELANQQLEKLNPTEAVDVIQRRNNKRAD